jgi:predicted secreted Zn-dependent protease
MMRNKIMNTKTLTILGAVLVVMMASASAESALQIAKAKDVTGKMESGACESFAQDLFQRMDRAGVEAYHIIYDWQNLDLRKQTGAHALIVFRDERGRYYGVDNMTWKPVWLQGHTPREWVKFFSGMDTHTQVVSQVATHAVGGDRRLASR